MLCSLLGQGCDTGRPEGFQKPNIKFTSWNHIVNNVVLQFTFVHVTDFCFIIFQIVAKTDFNLITD